MGDGFGSSINTHRHRGVSGRKSEGLLSVVLTVATKEASVSTKKAHNATPGTASAMYLLCVGFPLNLGRATRDFGGRVLLIHKRQLNAVII